LCKACGHRLEKIVMFSDPPLTLCPHCGKESLEQLISASSVHFKGSGWYKTDYASKTSGSSASSSGNDGDGSSAAKSVASSADSAHSAKTDTKSESKTESKPAAASSNGGVKK